MRLNDLPVIFHDSKYAFQNKIKVEELYTSMIFFSHATEHTYKPIIEFLKGMSGTPHLVYSHIEQNTSPHKRKTYNTLYIFDIMSAAISHWILSLRYFKQPFEFSNSIENLYERMLILKKYADAFTLHDISDITALKLDHPTEQEIIKRVVFLNRILQMFEEPFAPDLFDITEIDFHKLSSRYLNNTDNFNLVDRHIKCTPKKAYDICSKNLVFFNEFPEFEVYKKFCTQESAKFLSSLVKLGKMKKFYLKFSTNFPSQSFSGYFINELFLPSRNALLNYAHSPEYAPSYPLYNAQLEQYNILPTLVMALAPNNGEDIFNAPMRFIIENNRKFSFQLQGMIDSFLPVDHDKNPESYWEEIINLDKSQSTTLYHLHSLKKLTDYISFELTTHINKLLFSVSPYDYQRNVSLLHEIFASLESYFDVHALSNQNIAECDFTTYEISLIENFQDTMVKCFTDLQRAAENLNYRINNGVRLISDEDFAYWKFISLCFTENPEFEKPESILVFNVDEFCNKLKASYLNFMQQMDINDENKVIQKLIEDEITKLIVYYCEFYDRSSFFLSIFNISKKHLLENKLEKNAISLIFKNKDIDP